MRNIFILVTTIILVLFIGGIYFYSQKKPMTQIQTPTPTSTQKAEQPSYTLENVAKHNTKENCWMAINSKVYDVTPFVANHPGGAIIATGCGKDASILFNLRPNTKKEPHPETANQELKKLYIGELKK